jgi:hypothetical protein
MNPQPSDAPDVSEVEAGFLELPQQYRPLKQACDEEVVSWRWASDDLYEPRPLYFETHGYKKGRLLRQPPKVQESKPEYGYDETGVVRVARKHVRFRGYPDRLWFYETFYLHGQAEIRAFHFNYHPDKEPIFYATGNYDEEGRLRFWRSRARGGLSRETYTWDRERVVRIDVEYTRADNNGALGALLPYTRYEIDYAEDGAIQQLLCHWSRRPEHPYESTQIVYQRRPADVTFEQLLSTMRPALKKAVVDRVRSARISGPVYSLVLAWDPGQQESLPPSIGIGLDNERQTWIRSQGKEAKWYLWNPAEYENFLAIRTDEVEQACRAVNQECRLRDSWKDAERVLNALARELGEMDWTGILQTTDDFVAYAIDLQLTQLRRNLKYSARPDLVKTFQQRGWL